MIQSKEDYKFYLEADRIALNIELKRPRPFRDHIWRFQRLLRKVEFMQNCRKNRLYRIASLRERISFQKQEVQLGFSIPLNVFGPGLSIAHIGTIAVHPGTKVGENCRINHGVTLGNIPSPEECRIQGVTLRNSPSRPGGVPTIGNNVFIGPGAVVVGNIEIADGIVIGANSYVARSIKTPNITIAGCPAKKVSDKGSECLWWRATEILRARQ